jgi:hypothetical protein
MLPANNKLAFDLESGGHHTPPIPDRTPLLPAAKESNSTQSEEEEEDAENELAIQMLTL